MTADTSESSEPAERTLVWVLRATVFVQCLGHWRWAVQVGETPLVAWLLEPRDVGGLGWSESAALVTQDLVGWSVLAAGVVVLRGRLSVAAGFLAVVELLFATAMWRSDSGFMPETSLLSPGVSSLFPFTSQAARIAAPAALLLVGRWQQRATPLAELPRVRWAMRLVRASLVVTFAAHGWEAWQHYPVFTDLLIRSNDRLGLPPLSQGTAERLLTVIGVADFAAAVLCGCTRWRSVLVWMMVWGAITGLSRTMAAGWEWGLHATLARAAHVGLPAVLARYELLIQSRKTEPASVSASFSDSPSPSAPPSPSNGATSTETSP